MNNGTCGVHMAEFLLTGLVAILFHCACWVGRNFVFGINFKKTKFIV